MCSEMSDREEQILYVFTYMWNLKNKTNEYIGLAKNSFGFFIRCNRKTRRNFLANPITSPNTWKLNSMLLNNQWVREKIPSKIFKNNELKMNENTAYQSV